MNEDKELDKYKDIIARIKNDGEKIEAPQAVLTSVLEKVTLKKDERLPAQVGYNLEKQEEVSRPSYIMEYFNQVNIFMSKQSYIVAAVVLAVVAAGGLYWYTQNPVVNPGVEYKPTQKVSSGVLAVEVSEEVDAFDADLAAIEDFNSAQNVADLDALSKDLDLLNSI